VNGLHGNPTFNLEAQMPKPNSRPPSAPVLPNMPEANTEAAAKSSSKRTSNRPIHELRHRNLRATIWKNDTTSGPMYNVTVSRMYRDNDQWRDSTSFGFDDLMNLAKLLFDAHTYIADLRERDRDGR
jgi:hypothetical protein